MPCQDHLALGCSYVTLKIAYLGGYVKSIVEGMKWKSAFYGVSGVFLGFGVRGLGPRMSTKGKNVTANEREFARNGLGDVKNLGGHPP